MICSARHSHAHLWNIFGNFCGIPINAVHIYLTIYLYVCMYVCMCRHVCVYVFIYEIICRSCEIDSSNLARWSMHRLGAYLDFKYRNAFKANTNTVCLGFAKIHLFVLNFSKLKWINTYIRETFHKLFFHVIFASALTQTNIYICTCKAPAEGKHFARHFAAFSDRLATDWRRIQFNMY